MKKSRWSNYSTYLILADSSRVLRGTYSGYVNFKEVLNVLKTIVTKRTTTYLYNGEVIMFNLTHSELEIIQEAIDTSTYVRGFDKIRHIANKLNLKNI